jgi:hypothetical protein
MDALDAINSLGVNRGLSYRLVVAIGAVGAVGPIGAMAAIGCIASICSDICDVVWSSHGSVVDEETGLWE